MNNCKNLCLSSVGLCLEGGSMHVRVMWVREFVRVVDRGYFESDPLTHCHGPHTAVGNHDTR